MEGGLRDAAGGGGPGKGAHGADGYILIGRGNIREAWGMHQRQELGTRVHDEVRETTSV